MSETSCTRCGAGVPPLLSGPPAGKDPTVWWRNRIGMRHVETTSRWVLKLKMFRGEWFPGSPGEQVRMTYSELVLCDTCAGDVFLFAQGKARTPQDAPVWPTAVRKP